MKLTIEIDTGNAAFQDGNAGNELARILEREATALKDWPGQNEFAWQIRDVNGNVCGRLAAEQR